VKWGITLGTYNESRNKAGVRINKSEKCLICNKEFGLNDELYLAITKNSHNQFVCEHCAVGVIEKLKSEV
jgi:DNA-directed RNA polymerase subunit RPC12/RpoP